MKNNQEMENSSPLQIKEEEVEKKKTSSSSSSPPPEITLRPFDLTDLDDYMVWASDEKVSKFCSYDTYTSKEDLLVYLRDTVLPHPWFRAICVAGSDSRRRPVGAISVRLNGGNDRCRGEIGYVLASGYWGRGIVTAAVKAAAAAVFRDVPELERLEALVDVENLGSQRVMEKAGFVKEGVLRKYHFRKGRTRDMIMYSLLSTDHVPAA